MQNPGKKHDPQFETKVALEAIRGPKTIYWGKLRNGDWALKPKTSRERLNRCLKEISAWCRGYRHQKNQGAIGRSGEKANGSLRVLWCEFQ